VTHGEGSETTAPDATIIQPERVSSNSIPILIRATDGKSKKQRDEKIKLSTIVQPDALEGFFIRYAEVCKLGMSGLKKRNRSKAKEKQKAKKKKLGAGSGVVTPGDVKKA
jgi:signal recognition particle subunit SRP14